MELFHHGIKGQKWGVRRFQNADGSLTSQGKARYNDDSDALAIAAGTKYRNLADLNEKKRAAERVLGSNPKAFGSSKERQEYLDAMKNTQKSFEDSKALTDRLTKKYKDVKYDFLTEEKTGNNYVQAILTSKDGQTYISEIYLGYHVK